MSVTEVLLASGLVALGSLVHGSIGFGLGLIAAPFLVLIDPLLVPGPLLISGLLLSVLIGVRERDAIESVPLRWPLAGQLVGTAFAVAVLGAAHQDRVGVVLGAVVLVAVGLSVIGLRVQPTTRNLVAAGTLAGFMGTTASIPGPPLALVHQNVPAQRLRGTLVPFFVIGALFSLGGLAFAGRLGNAELLAAAMLLPGVVLGFAGSSWTAARIDQKLLRRSVLVLSSVAALALIQRSL